MITYDPKNWLSLISGIPRSPVFRLLFLDVLLVGVYAALVAWVETDILSVSVTLGPSFLSILGIILGLVLVFRTNTAYDRWWEGRRLWSHLLSVSRGLAHALDAHLDTGNLARRAEYTTLLASFPAALAAHLRIPKQFGAKPGAAALVTPSRHEPNHIVRALHRAVAEDAKNGAIPTESRIALQPLLSSFDDITSSCERIRNTPIPYSYSSYVKQFVLIYALVLPFGLVREFGYGTVLASMLSFFATMGLELLAGEIEEPFGLDRNDLPLDELAKVIVSDVASMLGNAEPVAADPSLVPPHS